MKSPTALVLAAGRGTRLGELGLRCVKALLPIGGRPLLDRHLEHLAEEGVKRVIVNAHHNAEQLVSYAARYNGPLDLKVVVEPALLGTAGGAINVLPELVPGPFLVVYGDVVIFEPLAPLLRTHAESRPLATLTVYESSDTHGKGIVEIDEEGRVRRFAEKNGRHGARGLINAGLYVIEPELFRNFRPHIFLDFGLDVFPSVLRVGGKLQTHRLSHPVLDIGTPEAWSGVAADTRSDAPNRMPEP